MDFENNQGLPTTQEELNALLQREGDRRVTEAMKKADKKRADAVAEAEKVARMDENQKYKYELEQKEAALSEREKKLVLAENKIEAQRILSSKSLPIELVDLVVAEDADTMKTKIEGLEVAFTNAVKMEVESRLKSATPKTSVQSTKQVNYSKMSLKEISDLMKK